jgi:CRP-like cAMP-binding protein
VGTKDLFSSDSSPLPPNCLSTVTLQQISIFSGLSHEQILRIERLGERVTLTAGEYLVREGDRSLDVYLILSGRAEVSKGVGQMRVTVLGAGAIVGEIALIERGARSASVRAIERLDVLALRESRFIDRPELSDIYPALMRNVSRELCERVREQNDVTVKSLAARVSMARFIVNFLMLSSLYTISLGVLLRLKQPFASPTFITLGLLVVFVAALFRFMRKSGHPLSTYGLTLNGWQRSLKESLIATAGFMLLTLLVKWVIVRTVPAMAGKPLIDPVGSFTDYALPFSWSSWFLYVALYTLFCPIQEFVARGGIQSALQQFLSGPTDHPSTASKWMANLIANCAFVAVHMHISISFALLAFIPGVLWGWLYSRQPTLVGISISHAVIGVWAGFVVNVHA